MTRRVVITGVGTVNPLASDVREFWKGLCAGKNAIGSIEQMDTSPFKVQFGGEVKGFNPESELDSKVSRRLDRFAQLALLASIYAVRDCGLDFLDRLLDIVGRHCGLVGQTADFGRHHGESPPILPGLFGLDRRVKRE